MSDSIGVNLIYSCIFADFNQLLNEIYKIYLLHNKENNTEIDFDYLFY